MEEHVITFNIVCRDFEAGTGPSCLDSEKNNCILFNGLCSGDPQLTPLSRRRVKSIGQYLMIFRYEMDSVNLT